MRHSSEPSISKADVATEIGAKARSNTSVAVLGTSRAKVHPDTAFSGESPPQSCFGYELSNDPFRSRFVEDDGEMIAINSFDCTHAEFLMETAI